MWPQKTQKYHYFKCYTEYRHWGKKIKKVPSVFSLGYLMTLMLVESLLEINQNGILLRLLLPKRRKSFGCLLYKYFYTIFIFYYYYLWGPDDINIQDMLVKISFIYYFPSNFQYQGLEIFLVALGRDEVCINMQSGFSLNLLCSVII